MAKRPNIKDIVRQEYLKCAKDPSYFMKKYCVVQHPMRGKVPFHLYEFQDKTLKMFVEDKHLIILKSRQLGLSTLSAGYSLWLMTFHTDKNILVIATKQETAKNLVTKVRVMHKELPSWLKSKCVEDNKLSLKYENGSQIKAVSSNTDSARSEALSLLLIDEAAFIDKVDEIWTSAQQTLATGGKAIILSTPNGIGNLFHKLWTEAENGSELWNFARLPWNLHPERDEDWRVRQDELLGPKMAAQECDCDFVSSGDTVIDGKLLEWYQETFVKEPVEKRGFDGNIWIWEQADYNKSYIVSADTARGDGQDYSAIQVIDIDSMNQVAEYKGHIPTKEFGNLCVQMATEYNDALLIMENASIGWAAIQQVIDRDYKNLFYSSTDLKYVDTENQIRNRYRSQDKNMVAGFSTTMRTRPLIIAKLEEYFREKSVTVRSKRLIDELFVFIYKNNKAQAMDGYNDDLTLALSIGLWVRDTALRLRGEQDMLVKKSLQNFDFAQPIYNPNPVPNNPYEMKVNGQSQDLTWLLDK
tara:strand:+ start:4040 stop:5620 length:1581 start_codon:yes stop_codon:yes gene_type:complete